MSLGGLLWANLVNAFPAISTKMWRMRTTTRMRTAQRAAPQTKTRMTRTARRAAPQTKTKTRAAALRAARQVQERGAAAGAEAAAAAAAAAAHARARSPAHVQVLLDRALRREGTGGVEAVRVRLKVPNRGARAARANSSSPSRLDSGAGIKGGAGRLRRGKSKRRGEGSWIMRFSARPPQCRAR